jgi:hypothetical protein
VPRVRTSIHRHPCLRLRIVGGGKAAAEVPLFPARQTTLPVPARIGINTGSAALRTWVRAGELRSRGRVPEESPPLAEKTPGKLCSSFAWAFRRQEAQGKLPGLAGSRGKSAMRILHRRGAGRAGEAVTTNIAPLARTISESPRDSPPSPPRQENLRSHSPCFPEQFSPRGSMAPESLELRPFTSAPSRRDFAPRTGGEITPRVETN